MNIDDHAADAQEFHEIAGNLNVKLFAVGHQHAHNSVLAQRFHAQRRYNGAVLAAGNAQNCVAALAVCLEPVLNPSYNLVLYLYCVKSHMISSVPDCCQRSKRMKGSPLG